MNDVKTPKINEIEQLIKQADNSIKQIFDDPNEIKEYLNYLSKFYQYSPRNIVLIQNQFPGAKEVGSFTFWSKQNIKINKGEKGIGIISPQINPDYIVVDDKRISINKVTSEQKQKIENGEIEVQKGVVTFKKNYVYDIEQTNADIKELPKLAKVDKLTGNVTNYNSIYNSLNKIANDMNISVDTSKNIGRTRGMYYPDLNHICLNERNSEIQNIKTFIHELTHAKLHKNKNVGIVREELQAEMTAYTVCNFLGIDTKEYSFNYINEYTKDAQIEDYDLLLKEVRDTSKVFIDTIKNDIELDKQIEKTKENNKIVIKEVRPISNNRDMEYSLDR